MVNILLRASEVRALSPRSFQFAAFLIASSCPTSLVLNSQRRPLIQTSSVMVTRLKL